MIEINGTLCHAILRDETVPKLSYSKKRDLEAWKQEVKEKLRELTGMDLIAQNACKPDLIIESDETVDDYRRIRFVFSSEKNELVPCYLLIPNTGKKKYPLAITLQGHSTGFHNSIGVVKYERDESYQPRGAFGVQAVKRGYAALCIEQRAMGERRVQTETERKQSCNFQAHNAFMLGRTIIGERVWDISRALDVITESFPQCDMDKVFITGNSGGGTASFYAACFDERIKVSIPSCAFCSYKTSIMAMLHCGCNYIPGARRYFEMEDLACLIAPRKLAIIAGEKDSIFPIEGVKASFEVAKEIFAAAGCPENVSLTVTPEKHWWCVDIVWDKIKEVTGW